MKFGYEPKKTGRVRFEFIADPVKDKDIIKKLNRQTNRSDYIRKLILKDIKKEA